MDQMRSKSTSLISQETNETLQLIRLFRSPEISNEAKQVVQVELQAKWHDVNHNHPKSSETASVSVLHSKDIQVPDNLNQKLRQLVQNQVSWAEISHLLTAALQVNPSPDIAVQFIELSFVYSTADDTVKCFKQITDLGVSGFYQNLHGKVRDFLIANTYESREQSEKIYAMINGKGSPTFQRTPTEIIFTFDCLSKAKDQTAAWIYYCGHKDVILDSCASEHVLALMSSDQLLRKIGRLALKLGYDEEARHVFAKLTPNSPERDESLQEILNYDTSILDRGRHRYFTSLESKSSWTERLELIEEYCRSSRKKDGFSDHNRPALNTILKSLIQWIPSTSEAWESAASLILRNADLLNILPDLWHLFKSQVSIFHPPAIDRALWTSLTKISTQNQTEEFLKAAAELHLFIADSSYDETKLWRSIQMFQDINTRHQDKDYSGWRDLIGCAQKHVETTPVMLQQTKDHKIACLRIAIHGTASSDTVIDTYLSLTRSPPAAFIEAMADQAWQEKNVLLFLKITARHTRLAGISPRLLQNVWIAANTLNNQDLAWRVATIASSRGSLNKNLQQTWEISGEKRSAYNPQALQNTEIEVALEDFPNSTQSALRALTVLGSSLNHLAISLRRAGFASAPSLSPADPIQVNIQKALERSCLTSPGKTIAAAVGNRVLSNEFTCLVLETDLNPWTYAVRSVLERLSAPAWNYQEENLKDFVRSCSSITSLASFKSPVPTTIGKWLNKLSSAERTAWSELNSMIADGVLVNFNASLACFAIRLATLIYPSHNLALSTLHKVNSPPNLIQDLEAFLLSPRYTAFRQKNGIFSRVSVPESFKSLTVAEDTK